MVEVHPLYPRKWEPSDPLVAYNNADGQVVVAEAMSRGNSSYYDRYGYKGSKDIVCADCKQDGRDVPVVLVESDRRRLHFRHMPGESPDGLGRHGETAEHLRGKHLIMDWAKEQHQILPWSIEEEFWRTGVRLRSDVKATLAGGRDVAFEIQRMPMERKDWDRRHGGYDSGGISDVWLWSPDVPHLILDLPLRSVIFDMEQESIGVLVALYSHGYRHPTAEARIRIPTHYASAPLVQWSISASGALVPPSDLAEYIGEKPEAARREQIRTHQAKVVRPAPLPSLPQAHPGDPGRSVDEREEQRKREAIARIFARKR